MRVGNDTEFRENMADIGSCIRVLGIKEENINRFNDTIIYRNN